jgi:hypothetical protein
MNIFTAGQREFLEANVDGLYAQLMQQSSVTKKKDGSIYWWVTVQLPNAKPIRMHLERHHPGEKKGWTVERLSGHNKALMTKLSKRVGQRRYPTVRYAMDDFHSAVCSIAAKMLSKK